MSSMLLRTFSPIYISILELTSSDRNRQLRLAINGTKTLSTGFIYFSNLHTSDIPNLSNTSVYLSLVSQTKCDNLFSDP